MRGDLAAGCQQPLGPHLARTGPCVLPVPCPVPLGPAGCSGLIRPGRGIPSSLSWYRQARPCRGYRSSRAWPGCDRPGGHMVEQGQPCWHPATSSQSRRIENFSWDSSDFKLWGHRGISRLLIGSTGVNIQS